MTSMRGTVVCWAICISIGVACASGAPAALPRVPPATLGDVETTLFLIGDSGEPGPIGHSVLDALRQSVADARGERVILFLGDNVYPSGIPDSAAADRQAAESKLRLAIDVVVRSGAHGIFVPGNHDWGAPEELGAITREERFIAAASHGAAVLLPANGCPGPAIVDIGEHLRLTALDTEWWLRAAREREAAGCAGSSEQSVARGLREALAGSGERRVIVAGHHPLVSGGPHGGHFGWREHVFPFRDVADWMWLPLPVVGSAYPFARARVGLEEDVFGVANSRMRAAIESAFVARPPLVYAAAHDHGLQVLTGTSARFLVVSGGGSDGDLHSVHILPSSLWAVSANGFVRLEVHRDGRVRLSVLTLGALDGVVQAGNVTGSLPVVERFTKWLM